MESKDLQKEKKIVFSEEIDSKISGFSLVLAFLSIGIFLLVFPDYFGNTLASRIIRWIFICMGILGFAVEFSKSKHTAIKGFDDFILGCILIALWVLLFLWANIWWVNIISFFILFIGTYGLYQGVMKIIYSASIVIKGKQESKREVSSNIILFLTKLASLVLVVIQIIKAVGVR